MKEQQVKVLQGKFVRDMAERAGKSGLQAAVAYVGVVSGSAWNMDPAGLGLAVLGGVLLSVGTSLASLKSGDPDTASMVKK